MGRRFLLVKKLGRTYKYQEGSKKTTEGVSDSFSLRKQLASELRDIHIDQVKRGVTVHSRGSALKEFKDHRTNTVIETTTGTPKRYEGVGKVARALEKGETDLDVLADLLMFKGKGTSASQKRRIELETPPTNELIAYLKRTTKLTPAQIEQILQLHSDHSRRGFARIREVARQRSLAP